MTRKTKHVRRGQPRRGSTPPQVRREASRRGEGIEAEESTMSEAKVWRLHCFGRSWTARGTDDDLRRYLNHLNKQRASNVISAQHLPHLAPHHGEDIAAELAKLDNRKN
jgi:hypothetical protein